MGMFSNYEPFEDHFKVGDKFVLQDAKMGATLQTEYGASQQVLFLINDKAGRPTWYSALGQGFVQQVSRLEPSELPTEVVYGTAQTKAGRSVKLLMPPSQVDEHGAKVDAEDIPF